MTTGTRPAAPKAPKGPELTELTVHPAPAPAAALDYRLLPELLDQTPGDAAPLKAIQHPRNPNPTGGRARVKENPAPPWYLLVAPKLRLAGRLALPFRPDCRGIMLRDSA